MKTKEMRHTIHKHASVERSYMLLYYIRWNITNSQFYRSHACLCDRRVGTWFWQNIWWIESHSQKISKYHMLY